MVLTKMKETAEQYLNKKIKYVRRIFRRNDVNSILAVTL